MSLLPGAPVSVSTFVNVTFAAVPAPAPVTFHVVSAAGPTTVSLPPPPSNVIATAAVGAAIVNVSAPSPPTTARPFVRSLRSFVVATPSIVTTASVSVVVTAMA